MVEGFGGGAHFSFHNLPSHLTLPTNLNGIHGHQAFVISVSATYCSSKRLRSSSRYTNLLSLLLDALRTEVERQQHNTTTTTTETSGDQAKTRCPTRCALIVKYSSMSSFGILDSGSHKLSSGP